LIQGNWTTAEGSNYTLLIDHRRYLQLTNALRLEQPTRKIAKLLDSGVTRDALRENALVASPITNQIMIGMTLPYSARLKWGVDVRATNSTSYEAYDILQGAKVNLPRVWAHVYSAQLIGNNLLFNNDLGVASFSYTNASTYNAKTLSFNQVASFRQNLQINISLQLYAEDNNMSVNLKRVSPSFRLSYHMNDSLNLECSGGLILAHTISPAQDDKTRKKYFNLGYRWNF